MRLAFVTAAAVGLGAIGCGAESDTNVASVTTSGGDAGEAPGARLACPPGEVADASGACIAPGVPVDGCGVGFEATGDGGCDPVLPVDPCAPGQVALPGQMQCAEVAPCPSGTWGDAPIEASTVFVDSAFSGSNSDGSAAAPFLSIQSALDAAGDGAVIAIAAGSYDETLAIDKPVRLWGRCPGLVTVASTMGPSALVSASGTGAELHDLAVSGAGVGVRVEGASGVLLDRVWLHDTERAAIAIFAAATPTDVTVTRSVVERSGTVGIVVAGATLALKDSVVRDTQPTVDGAFGRALSVESSADTGGASSVTVQRSVVERSFETGILVLGSTLIVEDSLVRDTHSRANDGLLGTGIDAEPTTGHRSDLSITGSVVALSHYCGICGVDADVTVDRTVVRDTDAEEATQMAGLGANVYALGGAGERPVGTIRRSLFERNHECGVTFNGSTGSVEATIVRDTAPQAADKQFGRGVSIEPSQDTLASSKVTLRGLRVEHSYEFGIGVLGSDATVESAYVLDTQPRAADGALGVGIAFTTQLPLLIAASGSVTASVIERAHVAGLLAAGATVTAADIDVHDTLAQPSGELFGDGIIASSYLVYVPGIYPTTLDVSHATVANSARAGVATFGAAVSLAFTSVSCSKFPLDGETIDAMAAGTASFSLHDGGGNVCGCSGQTTTCQVLSSNLEPPSVH